MHAVGPVFPITAPIEASISEALNELFTHFWRLTQSIFKSIYIDRDCPAMQTPGSAATDRPDIKAAIPCFNLFDQTTLNDVSERPAKWLYQVDVTVQPFRYHAKFKFWWHVPKFQPFTFGRWWSIFCNAIT